MTTPLPTNVSPHQLAKIFEFQIKNIITEKYSIPPQELSLLLNHPNGVYFSQKETQLLCVLVVGKKNGFLFLVTAKVFENGKKLTNFKSSIIS